MFDPALIRRNPGRVVPPGERCRERAAGAGALLPQAEAETAGVGLDPGLGKRAFQRARVGAESIQRFPGFGHEQRIDAAVSSKI